MIVRAIDSDGDWLFGKGKNDYKSANDAVGQSITTRLRSFLGDCFFSIISGIDWFNLLGSKNELALNLAINATILNSPNVTGLKEQSLTLDENGRQLSSNYKVQSTFGLIENTFSFDTSGFV